MAQSPAYAALPSLSVVQATAANTNRDGTGTIADLIAGANRSTRIERIEVRATGTTTAGVVRIFYKSTSGGTYRLLFELLVSAITPSASVASFTGAYVPVNVTGTPAGLTIPAASYIGVSTHNAETFNCFAIGGEL